MIEQLIILIRIAAVPSNLFVAVGSALTPEWSIRCVYLLKWTTTSNPPLGGGSVGLK